MRLLRVALILAVGGALGLLAVPFLPQPAQNWVANVQSDVVKAFRSGEKGADLSTVSPPAATHPSTPVKPTQPVQSPPVFQPETNPTPTSATSDTAQIERLVHDLVNKERQSHGVTPLRQDDLLSAIARVHSQDMAERGYFDHDNLLGQSPSQRAGERGYICRKDYGSYSTDGVAENISQNWLYSSITDITDFGPKSFKNYSSPEEIAASTMED